MGEFIFILNTERFVESGDDRGVKTDLPTKLKRDLDVGESSESVYFHNEHGVLS